MEFQEAVRGRRSIRKYLPDDVPDSDIKEIIELATLAPSASNKQMWKFIAVRDKKTLTGMREIIERKIEEMAAWPEAKGREKAVLASKTWNLFFTEAPVTIVVLGERYRSNTDELLLAHGFSQYESDELRARPDLQSIGGAIQTLLLAAYEKGYGTVWMTGPMVAARELEKFLGIEDSWRIVAMVPLGRPAENPPARPRKPVSEVLTFI